MDNLEDVKQDLVSAETKLQTLYIPEMQMQTDTNAPEIIMASDAADEQLPKQSKVLRNKKIIDTFRIQKILEDLSAKTAMTYKVPNGKHKRQKICPDAGVLLLQYAQEISSAILEESCVLAKHRNAKELSISDVKMIFGTNLWYKKNKL